MSRVVSHPSWVSLEGKLKTIEGTGALGSVENYIRNAIGVPIKGTVAVACVSSEDPDVKFGKMFVSFPTASAMVDEDL